MQNGEGEETEMDDADGNRDGPGVVLLPRRYHVLRQVMERVGFLAEALLVCPKG